MLFLFVAYLLAGALEQMFKHRFDRFVSDSGLHSTYTFYQVPTLSTNNAQSCNISGKSGKETNLVRFDILRVEYRH